MSDERTPLIPLWILCKRVFQHDVAEVARLEKNPDDVYEGYDLKPRLIDHLTSQLSVHSGESQMDADQYVFRAGRGCIWGERKLHNGEVWTDVTDLARRLADRQERLVPVLLSEIWQHYPREATAMGLPAPVNTQSPKHERPKPWEPPAGYVGVKDINGDMRFAKNGKCPPRTTIQKWIETRPPVPPPIKAPDTNEVHVPEVWVFQQIERWKQRKS